ncbi:MAG: hypothetical protein JXP34_11460 [Planctomycetes bacterium]|nr:hypothetical protein [Planctomycetota bacterium]
MRTVPGSPFLRFPSLHILLLFLLCAAPLLASDFADDFDDEADGPPEDFYVFVPTGEIQQGWLSLYVTDTSNDPFVFAGIEGTPVYFPSIKTIRFTIDYFGVPADAVGRHGGIAFCCTNPTYRYEAGFRGYTIDWIDRVDDHGYRIFKMKDGGTHYALGAGRAGTDKLDPGAEWEIAIDDGGFSLTVDGEELGYFPDADIVHSGYVGFWCYRNVGQNIMVDNVQIEYGDCPEIVPGSQAAPIDGFPGDRIPFSMRVPPPKIETAAYSATVKTSDPAIAGLVGAAGDTLTVNFPAGGDFAQIFEVDCKAPGKATLTMTADGGTCQEVDLEIAFGAAYEEDFAGQPDGPSEDWYVATLDGNVFDEEYELTANATEPTAYIGVGGVPIYFDDVSKVQFRIHYSDLVDPAIGAHGGIIIDASNPGATRYYSTNYVVDWLARDFTYRLYKTINGTATTAGTQTFYPNVVADAPAEYWRIEFTGSTIKVFATDEELEFPTRADPAVHAPIFEVTDTTHRSGYIGFWGHSNLNQQVYIDDVKVLFRPPECPSVTPASQVAWLDDPDAEPATVTVTIPFGANSLADYAVTVTSGDPAVAVPAGGAGGSLTMTFLKGDPLIQDFEIQPVGVGTARFSVTAAGADCPDAVTDVEVRTLTASFCDTFTQDDGQPEKWTIYEGDATVGAAGLATVEAGRMLVTRTVAGETWVWANGDDGAPARFGQVETISLNMELFTPTPDAVGRHGGILFFASSPTERWATSGYEIDWIDRVDDHGYRFIRSDAGTHTVIAGPTFDLFPEPAEVWELEIDDNAIRFYADDELVFEVFDATYRSGHVGLWTYSGGTEMRVDDVAVGISIEECGGGGKTKFVRGSADGDANYTIGDGVFTLNYMFAEGTPPACIKAADFDDNGSLTIGDPIAFLNFLFADGTPPPAPSPGCGTDPTDDPLPCESFPGCP